MNMTAKEIIERLEEIYAMSPEERTIETMHRTGITINGMILDLAQEIVALQERMEKLEKKPMAGFEFMP
jgi:hypothetical protein